MTYAGASTRQAFGEFWSVGEKAHWFPLLSPGNPWSACGLTRDVGNPDLSRQGFFGTSEDDCPECVAEYRKAYNEAMA